VNINSSGMNMSDGFPSICLIGAGNMGGAMLSGWLEGGLPAANATVVDPSPRPEMAEKLARLGVASVASAGEAQRPDVLIIAVKPQMMGTVLPQLKDIAGPDTVAVSVAAGTTIAFMEEHLGNVPIVRAMPNTPAILRKGITVCCPNGPVTDAQRAQVTGLLKAVGEVEWVSEERQIDAVTAVSGSGPAYVFNLAECMTAAGVAEGLPEELASKLARHTIAGAGEMLAVLEDSAGRLRENVTSPNGTTAAALTVLMAEPGLADLVKKAIHAARVRAEELSG